MSYTIRAFCFGSARINLRTNRIVELIFPKFSITFLYLNLEKNFLVYILFSGGKEKIINR